MKTTTYYTLLAVLTLAATWGERAASLVPGTIRARIARPRFVVTGLVLAILPLYFISVLNHWLSVLLISTVGFLLMQGIVGVGLMSLLGSLEDSSPQRLEQITPSVAEELLPRVATRLLFATLVYTGYLAVVYQGRFWFGPPLAVLTFVIFFIGHGLRERGKAPTLGVAPKIVLVGVGTLFTIASILACSALTGWVAFKAGFYDLFLGLANLDAQQIFGSVIALVLGAYMCSNMLLLYKLERVG